MEKKHDASPNFLPSCFLAAIHPVTLAGDQAGRIDLILA